MNSIEIAGDFDVLFQRASDIAKWPEFLPHYRWVKILEQKAPHPNLPPQGGKTVTAEMAARHKGLPLWWRTIQRPCPKEKRIYFTHVGGITKGMEVVWEFNAISGSPTLWHVKIHHEFHPRWPPPGPWIAHRIIGDIFVRQVADKTLKRLKDAIEGRERV